MSRVPRGMDCVARPGLVAHRGGASWHTAPSGKRSGAPVTGSRARSMVTSMKLLMVDGERKAWLYESRKECEGTGLKIADKRGEKTGSSMLPNLSTRPPRVRRNLSKKIS